MTNQLTQKIAIDFPLIQAPMAGVSTPALAAAVSNAGALGSLGLGASTVAQAETLIQQTRTLTARPFNVNLFCHTPPARDRACEKNWIVLFEPLFARFNAEPPAQLSEIYTSFPENHQMLDMLLAEVPPVVSFHFGLPAAAAIHQLHAKGIVLAATATSLDEARQIQRAGIDIVIAQGYEAGGHRGTFDERGVDYQTATFPLVQQLRRHISAPIVAAGGVMDGAGVNAMMNIGADGVQLGTAFLLCAEAATDADYREVIKSRSDHHTWMTPAISGRPARCIDNAYCQYARDLRYHQVPAYPLAYHLGKALAGAASAANCHAFGAHWAGQGINLIREMPAAALIKTLLDEYRQAANSTAPDNIFNRPE